MREVGVDLDHDVEAAGDADRVPGAVRAPESHLARPAQHFDPAELGAERFGLLGGPVRAVVVDDEDVRVRHGAPDPAHQWFDVLDFLVRRDGDPHARAVGTTHGRTDRRGRRAIANNPGVRSVTSSLEKKLFSERPEPTPVRPGPSAL